MIDSRARTCDNRDVSYVSGIGRSMATTVNEQELDERLALLEKARTWSPRLISKLESHIRTADDRALYRINPFTFAKERNIAEIRSRRSVSARDRAWRVLDGLEYCSVRNAAASSIASAASRACTTTIIAPSARRTTRPCWMNISLSPSRFPPRSATSASMFLCSCRPPGTTSTRSATRPTASCRTAFRSSQ